MQKVNKEMKKNKIKKQRTIKQALIVGVILLVLSVCLINIGVQKVKQVHAQQLESERLLEYEITEQVGEEKYDILIKVSDEDGIDYIKYPDGDKLYTNGRTTVGIDYQIQDEVQYDFEIKKKDEDDPVIETIYREIPKIKGDYQNVKGVYLNIPDTSGYESEYTRYLEVNKEVEGVKMTPGNWINSQRSDDWFDYKSSQWANIYFEKDGREVYYVWIPRYCFKLDQDEQRSDVRFIDTSNSYIDQDGNKTNWDELKELGYQVPEAFQFNDIRLPGYWIMKYTAGEIATPTIDYDLATVEGEINITNITLNSTVTNSNPIVKYTVALNGDIVQTITDETKLASIGSEVIKIGNINKDGNIVNITALNSNGEIVGSMTKNYVLTKANAPDLSSFDKETTFYVTDYNTDNEYSNTIISKDEPQNWYEYGENRGAHIVTRIDGVERYYTWIPRYETKTDVNGKLVGNFLAGASTNITPGYTMPSDFTIDGQEVEGYWRADKVVGYNEAPKFDTEVVATNTQIRTKGIIGTNAGEGQIYKYYLNGEWQGDKENAGDQFEYNNLQPNTKYIIFVEIRNKETNAYLGSILKKITTMEANGPDLTGFDTKYTRYLTLNDNEKLTAGEWINKDAPNGWYDYSSSEWANIYFEKDGRDVYYVWIPRYEFMITSSQHAQPNDGRTEVRFIAGTSTQTDDGYAIPEAFSWDKNGDGQITDDEQLPGYWIMKYTAGEQISPAIVDYDLGTVGDSIIVRNITTNASITDTNPITKYTIAINGEVIETVDNQDAVNSINSKITEITNASDGENIINVTGFNADGSIVGSMTKSYTRSKANAPDLSSFDKTTTFYVTGYNTENEYSDNQITKDPPRNWYEYGENRGAHIVTRIAGVERYYTWIPRYETKQDINDRKIGNFISGTSTDVTEGYEIPSEFTVNGEQVSGYWREDKVLGLNVAPKFDTEIVSTSSSIKTKGILGTDVADGQKYKYFLDGNYKTETPISSDICEWTGLESNKKYTVYVEIRNSSTNAYIASISKQVSTIEPNKPDLSGFNINEGTDVNGDKLPVTYYVEYDDNGQNERVGSKVERDGDGNATNMPNNWYDYSKSRWANIVVTDGDIVDGKITNATKTAYYVWIPRYEFVITSGQQAQPNQARTEIRFVDGTSGATDDVYKIPEAFTFNGVPIRGYWEMKYTAGQ